MGAQASKQLYAAAEAGDVDFLKQVYDSGGVHINSTEEHGFSALHVSSLNGQSAAVKYLLGKNANPNQTTFEDFQTPLHLCAMMDRVGVATELVLAGAKPDARDATGQTPLHFAAGEGCAYVARFLLEYCGVDVAPLNASRLAPLDCASINGKTNVARVILSHDPFAWKRALHVNGNSPLHYACSGTEEHEQTVRYLIKAGVDPGLMNSEKSLAMHLAASKNQTKVCEIFARYCGVDVHLGNQAGLSVAAVAVLNGCVDLVRLFISLDPSSLAYKGAGDGQSALHHAVQSTENSERMVELLCLPDLGLDTACLDNIGRSPADVARSIAKPHLAEILEKDIGTTVVNITHADVPTHEALKEFVVTAPDGTRAKVSGEPDSYQALLAKLDQGIQPGAEIRRAGHPVSTVVDSSTESKKSRTRPTLNQPIPLSEFPTTPLTTAPPPDAAALKSRPKSVEGLSSLAQQALEQYKSGTITLDSSKRFDPAWFSSKGGGQEVSQTPISDMVVSDDIPTSGLLNFKTPAKSGETKKDVVPGADLHTSQNSESHPSSTFPTLSSFPHPQLNSLLASSSVTMQKAEDNGLKIWVRLTSAPMCEMADVEWLGSEFPIVFGRWQRAEGRKLSVILSDDLKVDGEHCAINLIDLNPGLERGATLELEILGRGGVGLDGKWYRLGDTAPLVYDNSMITIGKRKIMVSAPQARPIGGLENTSEELRLQRARVAGKGELDVRGRILPKVGGMATYDKSKLMTMLPSGGVVKERSRAVRAIQRVFRGHKDRAKFTHAKFLRDSGDIEWMKKASLEPAEGYGEITEDRLFWDDVRLKLEALEKKIEKLTTHSAARRVQLLWSYDEKARLSRHELDRRKLIGPTYVNQAILLLQCVWRTRNAQRSFSAQTFLMRDVLMQRKLENSSNTIKSSLKYGIAIRLFAEQKEIWWKKKCVRMTVRIQCNLKCYWARQNLDLKMRAKFAVSATKIVATYKGHQARKILPALKSEKHCFGCATKLKAVYRGHMDRKKVNRIRSLRRRIEQEGAAVIITRAALMKSARNTVIRTRFAKKDREDKERRERAAGVLIGAQRAREARRVYRRAKREWDRNTRERASRLIQKTMRRYVAQIIACRKHAVEEVLVKRLGSSVAPQLGGPLGIMRLSKHRKIKLEQTFGAPVQRFNHAMIKALDSRWWTNVIERYDFVKSKLVSKKVRNKASAGIEARAASVMQQLYARKSHLIVTRWRISRQRENKRVNATLSLQSVFRGHLGRLEFRRCATAAAADRLQRLRDSARYLIGRTLRGHLGRVVTANARENSRRAHESAAGLKIFYAVACHNARKMRRMREEVRIQESAIKIQCAWRVRKARRSTRGNRVRRRKEGAMTIQRAYRMRLSRRALWRAKHSIKQNDAAVVMQNLYWRWRYQREKHVRNMHRQKQLQMAKQLKAENLAQSIQTECGRVWVEGYAPLDRTSQLDAFITVACRDPNFLREYEQGHWDTCGEILSNILAERGTEIMHDRDTEAMVMSVCAFGCEYAARYWRKHIASGKQFSEFSESCVSLIGVVLRLTERQSMSGSVVGGRTKLRLRGWALDIMGSVAYCSEEFGEALEYARSALRLEEIFQDLETRAVWTSHAAACLSRLGKSKAAWKAYLHSRNTADKCFAILQGNNLEALQGIAGAWVTSELQTQRSREAGLLLLKIYLGYNMALEALAASRLHSAQQLCRQALRMLMTNSHDIAAIRSLREKLLALDGGLSEVDSLMGAKNEPEKQDTAVSEANMIGGGGELEEEPEGVGAETAGPDAAVESKFQRSRVNTPSSEPNLGQLEPEVIDDDTLLTRPKSRGPPPKVDIVALGPPMKSKKGSPPRTRITAAKLKGERPGSRETTTSQDSAAPVPPGDGGWFSWPVHFWSASGDETKDIEENQETEAAAKSDGTKKKSQPKKSEHASGSSPKRSKKKARSTTPSEGQSSDARSTQTKSDTKLSRLPPMQDRPQVQFEIAPRPQSTSPTGPKRGRLPSMPGRKSKPAVPFASSFANPAVIHGKDAWLFTPDDAASVLPLKSDLSFQFLGDVRNSSPKRDELETHLFNFANTVEIMSSKIKK